MLFAWPQCPAAHLQQTDFADLTMGMPCVTVQVSDHAAAVADIAAAPATTVPARIAYQGPVPDHPLLSVLMGPATRP